MENTMRCRLAATCLALGLSSAVTPALAGHYVFETVAFPGARQTAPTGIDDAGDVVGYYAKGVGIFGFVMSKHVYRSVDFSGGNKKFEFDAVSGNGVASGRYKPKGASVEIGFTYDLTTGQLTDLPAFHQNVTPFPVAVSGTSVVVGTAYDAANKLYAFRSGDHASRLLPMPPGTDPGSTNVYLTAINRPGVAAGFYLFDTSHTQGFTFSSGSYTLIDVPGGSDTYVSSIRDDGSIAGDYIDPNVPVGGQGFMPGFVRFGTAYQTFSPAGSLQTFALRLTKTGQVLGMWNDGRAVDHGFIWQDGTVSTLDVPGSTMTQMTSASSNGDFVGLYARTNDRQYRGFVARCFSPPCR